MPLVTLADVTIRNLRPEPGRQVMYIDKTLKGFGVRVTVGLRLLRPGHGRQPPAHQAW